MADKIGTQIGNIEGYLDECKYITFSSSKIAVDREILMGMLSELQSIADGEIGRARQVVRERDKILEGARIKAQDMMDRTVAETNQMINEQDIMQQAYAHANEILRTASQQAQDIENNAVNDANDYRLSAVTYVDQLLAHIEEVSRQYQERMDMLHREYSATLGELIATIQSNRAELFPKEPAPEQNTDNLGMTADMLAPESGAPAGAPSAADGTLSDLLGGTTGSLNLDTIID